MGRELMRVRPGWEHPKELKPRYVWSDGVLVRQGNFDELVYVAGGHEANRFNGRRPHAVEANRAKPKHADWHWAVYETVSDGTPVTPAFETREQLVEYLVTNGDFWDQRRRANPSPFDPPGANQPWPRLAAERFVFETGWASTLVGGASGVVPGHLA